MSVPVAFLAPLGVLRSPTLPESLLIGPPPTVALGLSALRKDVYFSGPGRIVGTVKEKGTPNIPLVRRVRLHQESTGLLVREVWSDAATGAWSFDFLAMGIYYAATLDHTGQHNGEIATDLVPEPMVSA